MERVCQAAEGIPGLVRIGPWSEVDGGERVVGLAIWESRAAWDEQAAGVFAVVADDPFDLWELEPPQRLLLESP